MNKLLYILIFLGLSLAGYSENADKETNRKKLVSGKITDSSGQSIPGAKIVLPETGEIFFADMDGNYKLSLNTDKDYSITIHTIGFEPLEIKASLLSAFKDLALKSL
ncbi:MAG: carboxypeptidase-like regulatory domain-containing protein [bacterium]|nr:carboxypeptidase-like regulatory domain-containing protein [bacterium]